MTDDFSLRVFGIPDAVIADFWDKLDRLPKGPKHNTGGHCWCMVCRMEADAAEPWRRQRPSWR